jgi:hypothetical protein
LKPDIDGVLSRERQDDALLRLRLPSGRSPHALLRGWRRAAVTLESDTEAAEASR